MPREVIRFVLMWKGVPEGWLNGVVSLCKCCKIAVSVDGELSSLFSVKVGVHQGSSQSPLLFIIERCSSSTSSSLLFVCFLVSLYLFRLSQNYFVLSHSQRS